LRSKKMGNNIRNTGEERKKLEKWKKDLESIERELTYLNILRSDFEKFRKVVLLVEGCKSEDEPFLSSFKVFANLVLRGYVASIVMGIRRQLKAKGNEISLIGLLEDIKQNNQYISKSYYMSLHQQEDVKSTNLSVNEDEELSDEDEKAIENHIKDHIKERRKEIAEGGWKKLLGDCEYLPSEVVESDIKKLKDPAEEIEYFADKYVAHHDRKVDNSKAGVTLNKIDEVLKNFWDIYNKYLNLLKGAEIILPEGAELISLTPTRQFNDQKFFDEFEIWLKERLCDKK